jgi:hypothetical protein
MEVTAMSVEEVRERAGRFLRKQRRDQIVYSLFATVGAVFCAFVLIAARFTFARLIAAVAMTMLFAGVVRNLRFSYKRYGRVWPVVPFGSSTALTTCLDFYRNELERRREMSKQPAWQLAVALLVTAWLGRNALLRTSTDPYRIVLLLVLFAAAGVILLMAVRKFESREVTRELEALNRFEDGK